MIVEAVYVVIYFTFGYFVAWRFESVRLFYSGSAADCSFINKLISNWRDNPVIYLFQYFRGILFGCSALLLLIMNWKSKFSYFICMGLLYLCTAIVLIVPNFMFPDEVRWAHFLEMSCSMLLFSVIVSCFMWKCKK